MKSSSRNAGRRHRADAENDISSYLTDDSLETHSDSEDSSYRDDNLFDANSDFHPKSEMDLSNEDDNRDVQDQATLWSGNKYPPEYYIKGLKEFNESIFDKQDYSLSSTLLLDRIEEQWKE